MEFEIPSAMHPEKHLYPNKGAQKSFKKTACKQFDKFLLIAVFKFGIILQCDIILKCASSVYTVSVCVCVCIYNLFIFGYKLKWSVLSEAMKLLNQKKTYDSAIDSCGIHHVT